MNSLKVPDSGLRLESSPDYDSSLPRQAFAITLNDNVIEDMIKCVQGGGDIQLALGPNPVSHTPCTTHTIGTIDLACMYCIVTLIASLNFLNPFCRIVGTTTDPFDS